MTQFRVANRQSPIALASDGAILVAVKAIRWRCITSRTSGPPKSFTANQEAAVDKKGKNMGAMANPPPSPRPRGSGFLPLVTVVDFHHARGPEVEAWFGAPEGTDPAIENEWSLLPFMALSDGAHASTEDFSYFTLLRPARDSTPATSLFGISCTRQMDASLLLVRPADVTRSTVQKAVVVIADSPQSFGMLRERLSVVTTAWFAQREFRDTEILRRFQESLKEEKEREDGAAEEDREEYLGMSLRELVHEFKWQTLVLFKCCLLQPKDCADPELDSYEKNLVKPTSVKTSDRSSLLSYMGLPLQIFGKGSLYGPYTPLQQLDILADYGTKSYIVGSTNSLLLQQKDRYSDILINLDEKIINITSTSLRAALALSVADRRWIDFITQSVNETWDDSNPGRPKTMGYVGSEEFIRLQFEEYLLSLTASVSCHNYLTQHSNNPRVMLPQVDGDPANDFGVDWVEAWMRSENYRIWEKQTDSHVFDIVEPKHPCAGGLTIDDVQRRIAQQVQDFHLDERFAVGKEVLGRNIAAGKERASVVFNRLYADMEAFRENQRRKYEEQKALAEKNGSTPPTTPGFAPDLSKSQQTAQSVGSKAGAYMNSWATWMSEKRRGGAGKTTSSSQNATSTWKKRQTTSIVPQIWNKSPSTEIVRPDDKDDLSRPKSLEEYRQNIFDADNEGAKMDGDDDEAKLTVKELSPVRNGDNNHASIKESVAEAVEAATATPIAP
ncbi:hypothetical protein B7463_g680, partial [Scytalidium lignicola]